MAGHRTGVAKADIDLVETINVGEMCTAGVFEEDRERARPSRHPRHWNASEEIDPSFLGEYGGCRVGDDEAFRLFGSKPPQHLSIDHETKY